MFLKPKSASPPHRERPPAMLVGDEQPPPPPLVSPQARDAAAMLPPDLCVSTEGITLHRLPVLALGVLTAVLIPAAIFASAIPMPSVAQYRVFYTLALGGASVLSVVGFRRFVRHRKELYLTDDGVVLQVSHPLDRRPRVTRIPFRYIEDYTVSVTEKAATLRVKSVSGRTITLHDRPPRLATRELIRRFVEKAELDRGPGRLLKVNGQLRSVLAMAGTAMLTGGLSVVVLPTLGNWIRSRIGLVPISDDVVGFGIIAASLGVLLWLTLTEREQAWADHGSRRWTARLRNGLRRMFGIR